MTDHTKRLLLMFSAGANILVGCVFFLLSLVSEPHISEEALRVTAPNKIPVLEPKRKRVFTSQQFRYVWNKALQGPLVDPAPADSLAAKKAQPEIEKPVSRIEAKLVGTLVDPAPEKSRAWIEFRGKRAMYEQEETIQGHPGEPKIHEIRDEEVVLRLGQTDHLMRIESNSVLGRNDGEKSNAH